MKWRDSVKTGKMKIKIRNPFSRSKKKDEDSAPPEKKKGSRLFRRSAVKNVIEQDIDEDRQIQVTESAEESKETKKGKFWNGFGKKEEKKESKQAIPVRSRNAFERFGYNVLSSHLPAFSEFKEAYGQSGIPLIYEAYISTGFLLSILLTIPAFAISFIIEIKTFPHSEILLSVLGSTILSGTVFGITLVIWLSYPLIRKRSYRSKLENQTRILVRNLGSSCSLRNEPGAIVRKDCFLGVKSRSRRPCEAIPEKHQGFRTGHRDSPHRGCSAFPIGGIL